jgi:hypothetical protein
MPSEKTQNEQDSAQPVSPQPSETTPTQPSETSPCEDQPLILPRDLDQIEDGTIIRRIRKSTGEVIDSAVIRKPKKP